MPKHRCAAGIAPRNLLFPKWLPGAVETLHPRRLLVNWHLAWRRRSHWLVSQQPVLGEERAEGIGHQPHFDANISLPSSADGP